METTATFRNYNCRNSFKQIFNFKGAIAPIAEKASRNFTLKTKNPVNREQRLHYFALAYSFKQLDTENLFEKVLDETLREKRPTKFLALQKFDSAFCIELNKVVGIIRNINSHYIHDFEKLKTDEIHPSVLAFLKESFDVALIQIYLKEKEITYEQFVGSGDIDKRLVGFMHDKFYPLDDKKTYPEEYLEIRKEFKSLSKKEAIDTILFVEVDSSFDWMVFDTHKAFTVSSGKYLSFYACLFLLSMFLYKSEANQLISKIKGFKKNTTDEEKSKREIFSFFSKKFSSQDIDSEENHLVKFRDLIQYLNRYSLAWNKDLELASGHPLMTDRLKATIIDMEIDRSFPLFTGNKRFKEYARLKLWNDKSINNAFTDEEKTSFDYEINTCPELKDAHTKLEELKQMKGLYGHKKERNEKEIYRTKKTILTKANEPNPIKEKLENRIKNNLLFVSYGRNQDRFMDFATRYLAETKYFGVDAQFKLYQFFTSEEQNVEMDRLKKTLPKKEYDNLKFHQGKLVHYSTFEEQLARYESWDTPFVIENNAIQIKMNLGNGIDKIVSIQRGLMVYLLEDALYNVKPEAIENAGKKLLTAYYAQHQAEFTTSKLILQEQDSISPEQKNKFKKILPKRLLHRYSPAIQNYLPEHNTLQLILEKAKDSEARYEKLVEKAKAEGKYEDFVKRNKGKQFKLQFVRKAWHLMYFKDSYMQQVAVSGHHKRFHIERDEFNDFSRYLFAFDEVALYKDYLHEMLEKKGFLENVAFKTLFESGSSLDNLYVKTKQAYQAWIHTQAEREQVSDKYSIANYNKLFEDDLFYINRSHFIDYLKSSSKLQVDAQGWMRFRALENAPYLIPAYYYADKLIKEETKSCGKLYNKLNATRLEDVMLYEIGMRYLQLDKQIVQKAKKPVIEILNQDVALDIKDVQNKHLYQLQIPFNKIDEFVGLIAHKEEQDVQFKSSYLANIVAYLEKVQRHKDIKSVYASFTANPLKKVLTYDDLHKIDGHLVSNSIKFTNLALAKELYFVHKHSISIQKDNRITYDEIIALKPYFNITTRNKAFHFGVPNISYPQMVSEIEKKFIADEVRPTAPSNFEDLSKPLKSICNILLETLHNDYFGQERDGKKKRKDAEQRYFNEVIAK